MNKVALTRLAVMDLSITYARLHEGTNKITHYRTAFSHAMLGTDALQAVKDYIIAAEGPTEFELLELTMPAATNLNGLVVEEASSILANDPEILTALIKCNPKSQLLIQSILTQDLIPAQRRSNLFTKYYNPFISFVNSISIPIQKFIYGITKADHDSLWDRDLDHEDYIKISQKFSKIKSFSLREVYERTYHREIHPCTYLSVCYEEGDEALAEQTLLADLRKYHDMGMILGALALPSRLTLADTIGSGKRQMALFCFPFVDNFKIPGYDVTTADHNKASHLDGIRTATLEGSIQSIPELDPKLKYEITTVNVIDTSESNQKAYVDSYQAARVEIDKHDAKVRAERAKKG